MKKILLSAAFAVEGLFTANQSSAQSTATSTFNVVLEDVMSLRINGNTTTSATFNDIDSYINGINATLPGYLTVISTKAYKVTVKLGDGVTNASGVDVNGFLTLTALPSSNSRGNTGTVIDRSGVTVDATERSFILANGDTYDDMWDSAEALFDINYNLYGRDAVFGKAAGTNIIPVVFTISAP